MKIVTPNHGLPLDTFIMYGIIRAVSQREKSQDVLGRMLIDPKGEHYDIEIDDIDKEGFEADFYDNLYEAYKQELEIAVGERQRQVIALQNEQVFLSKLKDFMKVLSAKSVQPPSISELYSEPSAWKEWRSNRCKSHASELRQSPKLKKIIIDFTAQIALSPQLGKYVYEYDEGVKAIQQKICPLCTSLAILGILSYSVRMLLRENRRSSGWQFVTLMPTGKVRADFLSHFRRVFGKDRLITQIILVDKMPEIVTPLLLFGDTDTDTLEVLQISSPKLFTYRFEPLSHDKPQVMAVRKVSEYPASCFINFYLYVNKQASNRDQRLLRYMRQVEYSPFFSELALSILTDDLERFYNFLRGFATETARRSKTGKPAFFSDAFTEQALQFFSRK